jgi:hypothetical protein
MPENTKHISNFLRMSQIVSRLLAGVERDARLLDAVRRALDAEVGAHCLHATLEAGHLALATDGPVWALRLRFAAPELLGALRTRGTVAAEVRVRIAPASRWGSRTGNAGPPVRLSPATVTHLREAAAGMDDPDLAAALLRLAGTGYWPGSDQETASGRGA